MQVRKKDKEVTWTRQKFDFASDGDSDAKIIYTSSSYIQNKPL